MNIKLLPQDTNVEFYFNPVEIYKSEDEIKTTYFNHPGTVIAIVTKTNILKLYDFMGKVILFSINYFKDEDLTSKFKYLSIILILTFFSNFYIMVPNFRIYLHNLRK
jgi:hypothetical protein